MAFVPFTGVDSLLAEHAAALPQPDQLCGPFAARLAVVGLTGRYRRAGPVPDVAAFARVAGSAVWPHDVPGARPPGAPPRTGQWPGLDLATGGRTAGTSADGAGRAVEQLSGGMLAAVPASGSWTPDRLRGLLNGLTGVPVLPVANLDTAWLVSSHASPESLDAYLATGDDSALPAAEWSVGHFVVVYGREDGPGGTLLALADSYPQLGEAGRHRQPLPRVAAALARDRRRTGGLLLVTAAGHRETAGVAVRAAGLEIEWWDNGTRAR
ncbi:hypothetical protein [Pseudonocardia sp. NPDC049635]|uniref:DUF6885 family protein n=1 Tax=Pseudonocardia sp. NPDC049635 TaxID=3155506 RepID=UPI0033C25DAB